jgi:hypothetical protein
MRCFDYPIIDSDFLVLDSIGIVSLESEAEFLVISMNELGTSYE